MLKRELSIDVPVTFRQVWRPSLGLAFAGLYIFGFSVLVRASLWTNILEDLGFNDIQGGWLLLMETSGFLFANLYGNLLIRLLKPVKATVVAACLLIVGILLYSQGGSFTTMVMVSFILGSGHGFVHLCGNSLATYSGPGLHTRKSLSYTHIFFGLGALSAPFYVSLCFDYLTSDWGLIQNFVLVAPAIWGVCVLIYLPKDSYIRGFKAEKAVRSRADRSIRQSEAGSSEGVSGTPIWRDKLFIVCFFALIFYVAMDASLISWMKKYQMVSKHFTETNALFSISLWFMLLTIGRFLASLYSNHVRPIHLVVAGCVGTILYLAGLLMPGAGGWFLPMTGLFYSFIFPSITAQVSHRFPGRETSALALLFIGPSLGSIIGPFLVGVLNEVMGVGVGVYVGLVSNIILIAFLYLLVLESKKS